MSWRATRIMRPHHTRQASTADVRRVAMVSVHTSPLDQPGTGDAGGMNVYILEMARRLAARNVEVEIFTRATSSDQPPLVEVEPGVHVRHIVAGPFENLPKQAQPDALCSFSCEMLRAEAERSAGWYDLIHSHYWLSGQVAAPVAERWGVPLVHSMHTMAKVKNAALAEGDRPEPMARIMGEDRVVEAADRLIANTYEEAEQLVRMYDAAADKVAVVHPGVDLDQFAPGSQARARRRLNLPQDAEIVLFVGRIQPLKAPDVLVRAVARMVADDPSRRERLVLAIVGGPSGTGRADPTWLPDLAAELGVADVVSFNPPAPHAQLRTWYRAATVVAVPSHNESFGLVALEAQACGTPVIAAATGGLRTAVAHEESGLLVDGHDPDRWARTLRSVLADPAWIAKLGDGGVEHARAFGWPAMAERVHEVYADARAASEQGLEQRCRTACR